MKIINSLVDLVVDNSNKFNITIGNFDGVHLGHNQLFDNLKQNESKTIIYTFTMHPKFILNSNKDDFKYLLTLEEKIFCLEKTGIDYLFVIEMDEVFLNLSPCQFLKKYLPNSKLINKIIVGHDFCFGKDRLGDFKFLKCYYKLVTIQAMRDFKINDDRVSSTLLRSIIKNDKLKIYSEYCGMNYFLMGSVVKGKQLGRTIGFPTININVNKNKMIPSYGVYISKIYINNSVYLSISNLGVRPTINQNLVLNLETFVLGFDVLVDYGNVLVELIDFLRPEQRFSDINELKKQIYLDLLELRKCYI